MSDTLTYRGMGTAERGQAHALFSQTMAYVAATTGLFALGAYLGRHLTGGLGIFFFIAAFASLTTCAGDVGGLGTRSVR